MKSNPNIIKSILNKLEKPDLVDNLSSKLTSSELSSLLMEVFNQRSHAITPAKLLEIYQSNRFVKPATYNPIDLLKIELKILEQAQKQNFIPIEISPVTPLGTSSVLAPVHQNKVISAIRNLEVVSDSTNTIALHICNLKKQNQSKLQPKDLPLLKFCNIHRQLRGQKFDKPGLTPHFKTFSLITAGYDTGFYQFEKENLHEHIQMIYVILKEIANIQHMKVILYKTSGYPNIPHFVQNIWEHLQNVFKNDQVQIMPPKPSDNLYYKGLQFKIHISINNEEIEITDGGFIDWSQQILNNKKERMILSGFGIQRLLPLVQ